MNKGLEALERLMADYYEMCQDLGNNDDQYQRCNLTSERAIIEKELKRLEDIDCILNTGGGIWAEDGIVSKKLKVFEIIKEKKVDVGVLTHVITISSNPLKDYNETIWEDEKENRLTQEEYDLLKEVLYEKATA